MSLLSLFHPFAVAVSESSGSESVVIQFPGTCKRRLNEIKPIAEVIVVDEDPEIRLNNARWVRGRSGIKVILEDPEKIAYSFREGGSIVISKENFSNYFAAMSFCNSLSLSGTRYKLIPVNMAYGLVLNQLPFENLRETSMIASRVLETDIEGDRLRTGVIFWTTDFDVSPNSGQVYGFTHGSGEVLGGWQGLSELNERLALAGQGVVNIPGVCVEFDAD